MLSRTEKSRRRRSRVLLKSQKSVLIEMRLLKLSVPILSKFRSNHLTSSFRKYSSFHLKDSVLRTTYSPIIFPSIRCFSAYNVTDVDSPSHKSGKVFQERENEYAHKVMEKLPDYSNSLLKYPLKINFEKSSHLNIDQFLQVSLQNIPERLSIENLKFDSLIETVCSVLSEATDEDIKKTLYCLCLWPPTNATTTKNFKKLWNRLDEECVKRMKQWNVSEMLLINDYWFHLKLSRISQYNSAVIYELTQNIDALSNHEVVQLMFYVNLQRKIPDIFLHSLEKKLELIIDSLSVEEMGIICLGFFKTQSKITNVKLVQSVTKQFMYNVENLNTVTVAAILKFLRKSLHTSLVDLYIRALHKCVPCIDNFDIPTSVHLALLSSECNVYHPLLLNCVSEKLVGEIANVRIKDCEKFLLCLTLHNHFEVNFYNSFITEIKKKERQEDFILYPNQILQSILYYAYQGYYDYQLLAKVFNRQFLEETCLKHPDMRLTYAEIAFCVEIECPEYKGPKLNKHERNILQNRRGNLPSLSQKQTMTKRLLNDVYSSLVKIYGNEKNILIRHILPHIYSPDIIVRLSGNKNISLKDFCSNISLNHILKSPPGEVWAVFVVCGTYSFAYKSTQLTGITAMKLRQLQKIGYHVIFLPYFNVSRNVSQREKFIREKLNLLEEKLQIVSH